MIAKVTRGKQHRTTRKGLRMPRQGTDYELTTYGALVGHRLRELRTSHGLSMQDFRERLAQHGVTQADGELIPITTAYSWERGKHHGGADIPLDYYPIIAIIYGYKTPFGWLPPEFPDE